jgi:hypothetical protein
LLKETPPEFAGWYVTDGGVAALTVVINLNVFKDCGLRL